MPKYQYDPLEIARIIGEPNVYLDDANEIHDRIFRSGASPAGVSVEFFGKEKHISEEIYMNKIKEYREKHPEDFDSLENMHKKAYPNSPAGTLLDKVKKVLEGE